MTHQTTRHLDVLVVGAGPAGLAASLAFADAGLRTLCVDRQAPGDGARAADVRTTALLEPSIALLRRLGAWDAIEPHATPLKVMRLVEAGGVQNQARKSAPFSADDLDRDAFGCNVGNEAMKAGLRGAAEENPLCAVEAPRMMTSIIRREGAAIAQFEDGETVRAQLIVAADGRDSRLRRDAGIRARRVGYGQSAIVCVMRHARSSDHVSTEIHRRGGPFTLVPHTPDAEGPRSGLVWMMADADADRLAAADAEAFSQEATERSLGVLGPLRLASERARWPIISQLADRFYARRLALVAEAAHVVPPIGAQGLNMSLADAAELAELVADARKAGRDIASDALLRRYDRARRPDAAARVFATAAMNVAAIGAAQPIRDLRLGVLTGLFELAPARKLAMRFGLGG